MADEKTAEQLAAENANLAKENEALKARVASNKNTINDLKEKLKSDNAKVAQKLSIVKDEEGNSYKLLSKRFKYDKKEYTLEQLMAQPKLVGELAKKKLGILVAEKD